MMKFSLLLFFSQAQFIPLELKYIFHTFYKLWNCLNEDECLYNYKVYNYGINISSSNFTIGVWVQPSNNQSQKQSVISINYGNIILNNLDGVFCLVPSYGCYYQQQYQSWIYVYYECNRAMNIQQICFLESQQLHYPSCFLLPKNEYFIFTFFQASDIGLTNWKGNAMGITIKQNINIFNNPYSILDYLTLVSSVEPFTILNLRIYEKQQTKVLQDSSASQYFVQLGSRLDADSNDPIYNYTEQSIKFGIGQYAIIENFSLKETFTIEFQISSNNSPDQYTFLSLNSYKLQITILTIWIIPIDSEMIVNFPQKNLAIHCYLDVQNPLNTILSFISLPDRVKIVLIQQNSIVCFKEYIDSLTQFEFPKIDTLIIGSTTSTNAVSFSLYSLRISNGFYSSSFYLNNFECLYSIDQCVTCLNNLYVYNGQCFNTCPPGTISNSNRMECIPECHPTCETCSSTNQSLCNTCSGIRINPPNCICPPGYFDDGITPNCISYIPDRSVDSGMLQFQCTSLGDYTKEIYFNKKYVGPPKVVISLMGHLNFDYAKKFQVFLGDIKENLFKLNIVCTSISGFYNIQWISGQSDNLKNVIQNEFQSGTSFKSFSTTVNYINQIIVNLIGWIFTSSNSQFYLNFEQKQGQEDITSDNYFDMLQYQVVEFKNFIHYQIFTSLNFNSLYNSSVGRSSVFIDIDFIPLSIPSITLLTYMYYPNTDGFQYYITEARKSNQIQYDFKTTQQTHLQFFQASLLIAGVQCLNMTNACDFYAAMKICKNSSWNCGCSENQYYDYDTSTCQDCDQNCEGCLQKSTNCVNCPSGHNYSYLQNKLTDYYYCGCTSSQYLDQNTSTCASIKFQYLDCSSNCMTCEKQANNCASCDTYYKLTLNNGQCSCKTNEYTDQNDICQPCYELCLNCVSGLQTDCLNCLEPRYLNQTTKLCECQQGQYQDQKTNQCNYCHKSCKTCRVQLECITCSDNRILQINNQCFCDDGYFENENLVCIKCQEPCKTCSNQQDCLSCIQQDQKLYNKRCQTIITSQNEEKNIENPCGNGIIESFESCDDGYYLANDGCSNCEISIGWFCKNEPSYCQLNPDMIIKYIDRIQTLQYVEITFSEEILINSIYPLSQTMQFKINDFQSDFYNVSIEIIQEPLNQNELSMAKYILTVEIYQNMLVNPILQVDLKQNVRNNQNVSLNNLSKNITLNIPIYLSPQAKNNAAKLGNFNKNLNIGLACFSAAALFMGSSSLFSEILDVLQYQSYLKYISVDYPLNLQVFLSITDMVSISPIINFLHLEKYFLMIQSQLILSYGKFSFYQLDADLISNLSCQFLQILIMLSLYLVLKIIYKIIFRNSFILKINYFMSEMNQKGYDYINKLLFNLFKSIINLSYLFNLQGFKSFMLINSWDLLFKVFIYLEKISFDSIRNIIAANIAIFIMIYFILFLFSPFMKRNEHNIKINILNQTYFNVVTVCRTISFLAILVFIQYNQTFQVVLVILNSLSYVIFLRYSNLVKEQQDFVLQLNDITVVLFTIMSCSYIDDFKGLFSEEQKQFIGFIQIIILSLCISIKALNQIYCYGKKLYLLIKKKLINHQRPAITKKIEKGTQQVKKQNIVTSRVLF